MKSVFVVGGASVDTIIYLDNFPENKAQTIYAKSYQENLGSTGIGKALNLCNLLDTTLYIRIGKDIYGEKIKERLCNEKLKLLYDIDETGHTKRHMNLMDKYGERISIFLNTLEFDPKLDLVKFENEIVKNDIIVLNILNYTRHLIPICKKHNKEIWTDLHDYDGISDYHEDFIQGADYVLLSSEKLGANYKEVMEEIIAKNTKVVICTHGKNGATLLTKDGKWYDLPIIDSYDLVDSNGAGDSFFSGFLYGIVKGYTIEKALDYANICAGLCVSSKGLASGRLNQDYLEEKYTKLKNK